MSNAAAAYIRLLRGKKVDEVTVFIVPSMRPGILYVFPLKVGWSWYFMALVVSIPTKGESRCLKFGGVVLKLKTQPELARKNSRKM